ELLIVEEKRIPGRDRAFQFLVIDIFRHGEFAADIVDITAVATVPADDAGSDIAADRKVDEAFAGVAPVAVRNLVHFQVEGAVGAAGAIGLVGNDPDRPRLA